MTNKFHLSLDQAGTWIIAFGLFLFLLTNTWHFIQAFIPADTFWHQPVMLLFFEGGLLYWTNRLIHASENVVRTVIAAFMTLVQFGVVLFATVYEVSLGLQQKAGIDMSPAITAMLPWVIVGVIFLWLLVWMIGRLASPHFAYRVKHIAKHGYSPHLLETSTTVTEQAPASFAQTGTLPALPTAKTSIANRLHALDVEHPGLNHTELARIAGVSTSTVSRWRRKH